MFFKAQRCLSLQFLKSKADLEYIEKRLKLDFINMTAETGCQTEMVNEQKTAVISPGILKQIRTLENTFHIQISKWVFHQIAYNGQKRQLVSSAEESSSVSPN